MQSSKAPPVPSDAPAVERGVGFFETVLVVGRRPILWARHVARLQAGLRRLDLPAPSREEVEAAAAQALSEATLPESALRLTWIAVDHDLEHRGSWRLDASLRPIPKATLKRRSGCHAYTLPPELTRDTPGLKSTSYLASVLGLRHALRRGGDEGFFIAADRSYIEGTATSVVAWAGGRLLLSSHAALPSVTVGAFTDLGGGDAPRGALTAPQLREGALVLGSLTCAAPLVTLDGEPCAQPAAMLERIAAFNQQMIEGTVS